MAGRDKTSIVEGVKKDVIWWVDQRRRKLEDQLNESMTVNPFLAPFLFDYHNLKNFDDLASLLIAGHLLTGHSTGFGKLVDEKILPNVFGTKKLDAVYRRTHKPLNQSCFDEIDHIIDRKDGRKELLSLKASKWTIQLTMAVQLNASFAQILKKHKAVANSIVVGVFYGKHDELTDKYDILRGVNRGANHDVIDLRESVSVFAGREFWQWLNDGVADTQEWLLAGILGGLQDAKIHSTAGSLLNKFREGIVKKYKSEINDDDSVNWQKLLKKING